MHPKDFQSLLNIYLMKQNINFFYRHTGFKDKFCEILIDNAQAIINFQQKKWYLQTEALHCHKSQKFCYIGGEETVYYDRIFIKMRGDCHFTEKCRGALHSICNSPCEIPIIVHNGPNYDFDPMIEYPSKKFFQVILSIQLIIMKNRQFFCVCG